MNHERIASPRGLLRRLAGSSLFLAVAAAGSLACVSQPGEDSAAEPRVRDDLLLSPELLPTPFSAAEIRDGNTPGTTRTYLVMTGGELELERTTFLEDPKGLARFRSERRGLDGESLGEPGEAAAPWEALQRHASYPRAEAARTDAICTTAAGRFDAWLYDWRQPARDGEPASRHRVWFAKEVPGPPVLYETTVDGELVFRMELIEAD